MHKGRPRGRLASKYDRALAHWDARPMAPDWPKDRWFQEGGVRGQSTGPSFLGLGNGWGKLEGRMQREGTSRQGSVLETLVGEDAGFARYRLLNPHHSTSSLQDAGVPRRPVGLPATAAPAAVTAAGARNEMKVLCRAASQKLAMQQGRASVPSPRSLTIAFSALLFWSDVATVGQQTPVPLSRMRKIRHSCAHVLCQNVCRGLLYSALS